MLLDPLGLKTVGNNLSYIEMIPSQSETHHIFNLTIQDINTVLTENRKIKILNTVIVENGHKR